MVSCDTTRRWRTSSTSPPSQVAARAAATPSPRRSTTVARPAPAAGGAVGVSLAGRAVAARPDLARALVERGHLVANHSWRHDSKAWLDPRYPELARTERVVEGDLGVCPAFYRAPHGQHTPLLARVVHGRGLTMVGWDVSAGDWKARNPANLARRIVAEARPGSIIDLHDGLDGRVDVDRTVLVAALPAILDGLAAKGLQPVRLDELLARPGYLTAC